MHEHASGERGLLDVRRLGRRAFSEVWKLQHELVEQRVAQVIPDTLILTEHESVLTIGRAGSRKDLVTQLEVFEVERGGDLTWHGPGQIVAYPIFELPAGQRDARRHLRQLEEVVLRVLAEFDLRGERRPDLTGVWIGDRKVCSIGVAFRRWVSYHGLALNLYNSPDAYAGLRPCGLNPESMTRIADHAAIPEATILFEVLLIKHFLEVFALRLPDPQPRSQMPDSRGFPELPLLDA